MSNAVAADAGAVGAQPAFMKVENLHVVIPHPRGDIQAVRNVSLKIAAGERVVILGESGCGKTMTALALLGLQPPNARVSGSMVFDGRKVDLAQIDQIEHVVRRNAGVVFQDSLSGLNPVTRIGTQLAETLLLRGWPRGDAFEEAVRVLGHVGMPDARARMRSYPHELSGGMRQRVMISIALLAKPSLLVADEPTTALDTTVQAQVIDLIRTVQAETDMSLLLITHDLAMAAEICDRAIVMYAGYVVEDLPMDQLLQAPAHPYARALLEAMPRLDSPRDIQLDTIEGELPSARESFAHCPFAARCAFKDEQCMSGVPRTSRLADNHNVRCVHPRSEPLGRARRGAMPIGMPQ